MPQSLWSETADVALRILRVLHRLCHSNFGPSTLAPTLFLGTIQGASFDNPSPINTIISRGPVLGTRLLRLAKGQPGRRPSRSWHQTLEQCLPLRKFFCPLCCCLLPVGGDFLLHLTFLQLTLLSNQYFNCRFFPCTYFNCF